VEAAETGPPDRERGAGGEQPDEERDAFVVESAAVDEGGVAHREPVGAEPGEQADAGADEDEGGGQDARPTPGAQGEEDGARGHEREQPAARGAEEDADEDQHHSREDPEEARMAEQLRESRRTAELADHEA